MVAVSLTGGPEGALVDLPPTLVSITQPEKLHCDERHGTYRGPPTMAVQDFLSLSHTHTHKVVNMSDHYASSGMNVWQVSIN